MSSRAGADWVAEQDLRIDGLIDEYRLALHDSLNHLSEEEVRLRLVPSKTTMLGLVKHACFSTGEDLGRCGLDDSIAAVQSGSPALSLIRLVCRTG